MADGERLGLRPRGATERRLAVVAHAAGVLGLSLLGWPAAAAVSIGLLLVAERRRSRYLVAHSGQAALYQLAVFVAHLVFIAWLGAGFLSFGGELPGIGDWRIFDTLREPWLTILQVTWGLSVLVWPLFYGATVLGAAIGAWRTARDRPFWYPLVSGAIRRLAEPRPSHPEAPAPDMPAEEVSPEGPAV